MKTLLPIEYGKRIKRARQAKNLTQRQLADLANLSDSAISKYEKQGTTDVNVLNSLSEVLGISLFSSPADAEGTIGVVGKEIMSILVLEGGYIDVETLVDEHMHGMDNDSVTDEIVKLSQLGMVVREPYKDFADYLNDGLFITAKGLIAYKNVMRNIDSTDYMKKMISLVKTYEQSTEGYEYYQDYVNAHVLEKLISNLDYVGTYRIDYIIYLKRRYHLNIEDKYAMENLRYLKKLIPAKSIYHDLLYRMLFDLTNKNLWDIIESGYLAGQWVYINELMRLVKMKYAYDNEPIDTDDQAFSKLLRDCMETIPEWYEELNTVNFRSTTQSIKYTIDNTFSYKNRFLIDPEKDYQSIELSTGFDEERLNELLEMEDSLERARIIYNILYGAEDIEAYMEGVRQNISDERNEDACSWHIEWFSVEEQIEFFKENFRPAKTAKEKELDRILKEINRLCPETLEYYDMPGRCERNGLADIVRKTYNL